MNFNLFSLFNYQKEEINIYSSDIEPTIKLLNKSFNNYQISDTLENLKYQFKSHSKSPQSLYYLYILKAEYLIKLQRLEEFKELIAFIKSTYHKFIDNKFDDILLMYFTLLKDEKNYYELAKKISITKEIDSEYFEGIFFLNIQNPKKAKEIFLKKYNNISTITANNALIFGYIYRDLIYDEGNIPENYTKMLSYYTKYIETKELIDSYDLITINISKSILPLEKVSLGKKLSTEEKEIFQTGIDCIKTIVGELHNFSKAYQFSIINNLLYFYIGLNQITEFEFFAKKNLNILNVNNTLTYYLECYKDISSDEIYELYTTNKYIELLIAYLGLLNNKQNTKEMRRFIENKNLLSLNNSQINKFYDLSQVEEKINLSEINTKYFETKSIDLFDSIIYLKSLKYLERTVQVSYLLEIKKLIIENPKLREKEITNFIDLLFDFGQQRIAYELVIEETVK